MTSMIALPGRSLAGALARYRSTGADLPFGDPGRAHGVAMEGYFWRLTDVDQGRVVIALIGVNRAGPSPEDAWATLGLAAYPSGVLRVAARDEAWANPRLLEARSGTAFAGDSSRLTVDLGPDARMDVTLSDLRRWPRKRTGGSSYFHSVPGLNQYWHPWLLGGRANGTLNVGEETWQLRDAAVYGEKNWGREGFPDAWWWGQAQGFAEPGACVAFAGGDVVAGPVRTTVTALVVRLPDGRLIRLGNPVSSPVNAHVTDESWRLHGRGLGWTVDVEATAPLDDAFVLPVPLPSERRNTAGAIEHLGGDLDVVVRHRGRLVWRGHSALAGLEHGGLSRAEAEMRRRGAPKGVAGWPPRAPEQL